MAMTHRSLVPAVLLLAVVVFTTTTIPAAFAVASTANAAANDSLTKACNKTNYPASPSECVDVQLRFSPESLTASPHRLAELSYQYLLKAGDALSRELDGAVAAAAKNKRADEGYRNCLDILNANVKQYLRSISRFSPEHGAGAAAFSAAKDNLREILSAPSNTGVSCPENAIHAEPAVNETYVYEDMLQVTLDLMSAAATAPEEAAARRRAKEEDADDAATKEELIKQRIRKWQEDNDRMARQIGRDPVVTACNESGAGYMLVSCAAALGSYPVPEVVAATPRRRAGMMCAYLLKKGDEVGAELSRAAAEAKGKSAACVQAYDGMMRSDMASIAGLSLEKSSCGEAFSKVEKIMDDDTDPRDNCTAKDLTEVPVIAKFDAFYELVLATAFILNNCKSVQP